MTHHPYAFISVEISKHESVLISLDHIVMIRPGKAITTDIFLSNKEVINTDVNYSAFIRNLNDMVRKAGLALNDRI